MAIPGALVTPTLLTGKSGLTYEFDAYLRSEPSALARTFGLGAPGFAVFVKAFESAPGLADLQAVKRAVEDLSLSTKIPPARVLAVWRPAAGARIPAEAYDFLIRETIHVKIRGAVYACSVELATESADGTYDFIPIVVGTHTNTRATARTAA